MNARPDPAYVPDLRMCPAYVLSQPYAEKTSAQGTTRDVMLRATMNGKFRF